MQSISTANGPREGNIINNILLVDDDLGAIQLMGRILAGHGQLRFATNGPDAARMVRQLPPDLVILDAQMPDMSGIEVFHALKAEPQLIDVPVIFITSRDEAEHEVSVLEMGAADFIAKPVNAPLLVARVRTHLRIKRLSDQLRRTATTDALTGIANRRLFDATLAREWQRARRQADPLSLLLIDVDHFKPYNDYYGHPKGDACLRELAQAIAAATRCPADFTGRYGGEEFAVLLPLTNGRGGEHVAERILNAVNTLAILHEASETAAHVTVSIGVGHFEGAGASMPAAVSARSQRGGHVRHSERELLVAADNALYRAKRAGRAGYRVTEMVDMDVNENSGDSDRTAGQLHGATCS